jgi:putative transposase
MDDPATAGSFSLGTVRLAICFAIATRALDHIIVLNETGLRRVLKLYFEYYERTRTHLSLDKDAPIPRTVQPPELGRVVELPEVGGLLHRYERRAA